ncbi:MAG: hypothetical protein IT381_18070 [Deltaproteobacteria bacterium]|nr:hypothetical protein [Deltaproteobacteria bacterium]
MFSIVLTLIVADGGEVLRRATELTQSKEPAALAEAQKLVEAGLDAGAFAAGEERRQARVLQCEIAFAQHDKARFIPCGQQLAVDFADSAEALYYAHLAASLSGKYQSARGFLDMAGQNGLPAPLVEASEERLNALDPPPWWRTFPPWLVPVLFIPIFSGVLVWRRSRKSGSQRP